MAKIYGGATELAGWRPDEAAIAKWGELTADFTLEFDPATNAQLVIDLKGGKLWQSFAMPADDQLTYQGQLYPINPPGDVFKAEQTIPAWKQAVNDTLAEIDAERQQIASDLSAVQALSGQPTLAQFKALESDILTGLDNIEQRQRQLIRLLMYVLARS